MRTKSLFGTFITFICIFILIGCRKDDHKDKTKTIHMFVSSETSTYISWESDEPKECMLVKEEGEPDYKKLDFSGIAGFTYEKGYEYKLLVKKTILANPPADASNITYQLTEVLDRRYIPSVPEKITEARIAYKDGCPYPLYKIDDSKIAVYSDGKMTGKQSEKSYRLGSFYLEKAIGPDDEYYDKQTYMATSAYVADPFPPEAPSPYMRSISRNRSGFAFKNILTEDAYEYMKNEAPEGTELKYRLILVNAEGLGLQEIEVSFIKK